MSWGTKGSDKADALPTLVSKKGKEDDGAVVEDTARLQEDVDAAFKETVTRAVTKVETKEAVEKPTTDDQNKTFRTRLVAMWMLSNAGLSVAVENLNGLSTGDEATDTKKLQSKQQIYFAVILYSTFGLAFVRFMGVSNYSASFCRQILIVSLCSVSGSSSNATSSGAAVATKLSLCTYRKRIFTLSCLEHRTPDHLNSHHIDTSRSLSCYYKSRTELLSCTNETNALDLGVGPLPSDPFSLSPLSLIF